MQQSVCREFFIKSKGTVKIIQWWGAIILVLLYLESNKLVNGQLEAVGAVLSVVPVTSILATAGLVGVKLAALSRLLQVLGYDQAYLRSGGSGTAAQPIGLQNNYAYMFPYVPGLNISVKGDMGSYQNPASHVQTKDAALPNTRKTYPAMVLPGDYEQQNRPFRGSETLRDIFKQSGIKMQFPTKQQQQQLASLFPNQGNGQAQNLFPDSSQINSHESINIQPIIVPTTPTLDFDNNNNNNNYMNNKPAVNLPASAAQPQPLIENMHVVPLAPLPAPPPPPSSSASLIDDNKPLEQPNIRADQPQPFNSPPAQSQQAPPQAQSSWSFQAQDQVNQQRQPDQQQQQPIQQQLHHPQIRGQAAQVSMPHPKYNQPPQSNFLARLRSQLLDSPSPPERPFSNPANFPIPINPSPFDASLAHPNNGDIHSANQEMMFHPVPQHEIFHQRISTEQKRQDDSARPFTEAGLPTGPILREQDADSPLRHPIEYFDRFFFGNRDTPSSGGSGAGNGNGAGNGQNPNEVSTNYFSLPFVTDGSPPFHDDLLDNKFVLVNRRRKRDLTGAGWPSAANQQSDGLAGEQYRPLDRNAAKTFGMPTSNIHPLRKRRSLADIILPAHH